MILIFRNILFVEHVSVYLKNNNLLMEGKIIELYMGTSHKYDLCPSKPQKLGKTLIFDLMGSSVLLINNICYWLLPMSLIFSQY